MKKVLFILPTVIATLSVADAMISHLPAQLSSADETNTFELHALPVSKREAKMMKGLLENKGQELTEWEARLLEAINFNFASKENDNLHDINPLEGDVTDPSYVRELFYRIQSLDQNEALMLVKSLLAADPKIINFQDYGGQTLLHIFAEKGETQIVDLLLRHGADMSITDSNGKTALDNVLIMELLPVIEVFANKDKSILDRLPHDAFLELYPELIKLECWTLLGWQLDKLEDVNPELGENQLGTPLVSAILEQEPKLVAWLIEERNADPNGRGGLNSPLHMAAQTGNIPILLYLIRKGADIKQNCPNYGTALHYAAMNGKLASTSTLIDQGADVNAIDNSGKTPLHYAVEGGEPAAVLELITRGADCNRVDNNGDTPLLHAFKKIPRSKSQIILNIAGCLLDHGAEVNCVDQEGNTPLHCAVRLHSEPLVKFLVERGADVERVNNRGWTPLMLAEEEYESDDDAMIELLMSK